MLSQKLLFRYKWKAVSCLGEFSFFCMAETPYCPPGYTWLPKTGTSCFKVTDMPGTSLRNGKDTKDLTWDEPTMNKYCAAEGTRLASFYTDNEFEAMMEWFTKERVKYFQNY